jgi:Sec-independent protein translocase protein TatA
VFGLEPNELALVVFLAVLITAMGWLSRLGEWLGARLTGNRESASGDEADAQARPAKPSRQADPGGPGQPPQR